jgi:hypothetical protein
MVKDGSKFDFFTRTGFWLVGLSTKFCICGYLAICLVYCGCQDIEIIRDRKRDGTIKK